MASTRQKARTVALQALYEADMAKHPAPEALERLLIETRLAPAGEELARALVRGVFQQGEQIDAILQEAAPMWPLDQVAAIDRNVLRIAVYELVALSADAALSIPAKVTMNEAVSLAKTFGSEGSPRFVNGVLGTVNNKLGALQVALIG